MTEWKERLEGDRFAGDPVVAGIRRGLTRRDALRAVVVGLGGIATSNAGTERFQGGPSPIGDDVAIDPATTLVFSAEAPLVPASGMRDARAVWCHAPANPDKSVLIYFHGHNGYVTVDAKGRSRVPDWAADNEAARAAASAKPAAPLVYGLDRLESRGTGKKPIVLVPEVSTLATGSFWAKEPAGQYADPARLGSVVADCLTHLGCLHSPTGSPYLAEQFLKSVDSTGARPQRRLSLDRVYLCGHSGAGLPIEEAATSAVILPETGVPADLWLFDATYWSKVDGFVRFCERWHRADRLAGGRHDAARFVCIYRPRTSTEEVADDLRGQIAKAIGADPAALVKDHSPENLDKELRPALQHAGVLFVRTYLPHDEIPTFFIPVLLASAANRR
jgi:hypothetical protein